MDRGIRWHLRSRSETILEANMKIGVKRRLYAKLNPTELKRQIIKLQNKLLKLASLKESMRRQEVGI